MNGTQTWLCGLMLVVCGAVSAQAGTSYTWNSGNGNWTNNPQLWSPGGSYPGQADTTDESVFASNIGRTVTVNANVTNQALTVTGTGAWAWANSGGKVLTINAGNLNYSASNTTYSTLTTVLAGNGALRVNSGLLRIFNPSNTFSGGVEINAGILKSGREYGDWTEDCGSNDLGRAGVVIGATNGANDATLLIAAGGNSITPSYPHPFTIRSGSSGRAQIGAMGWRHGGPTLVGPITLQKDLYIVHGDTAMGWAYWDRYKFAIGNPGGLIGTGNVIKDGLGVVYLSGTNTFTGDLIQRGGHLSVLSTTHTNEGAIRIERGYLWVAGNGSLGHANNTLTLGTNGSFGGFATTAGGAFIFPRALTLAGNGGLIRTGGGTSRPYLYGKIGGPGRLIFVPAVNMQEASTISGTNDYAGGTIVADGAIVSTGNGTTFGSGNVRILNSGMLSISSTNSIAPGAKVLIERHPDDMAVAYPGNLALSVDYVPDIDTNSSGGLALRASLNSGPVINARLADGAHPLGNGTMFFGNHYESGYFTGTSLVALVVNDPTHTYRLGSTRPYATDTFWMNSATYEGALKDLNGYSHNVQIGMAGGGGNHVGLSDSNSFTGTLTINPAADCTGYLPVFQVPGTPFGSETGAVVLNSLGGWGIADYGLKLVNQARTNATVRKGTLTFNGSTAIKVEAQTAFSGAPGPFPFATATVHFAAMTRADRSVLSVAGHNNSLGNKEQVTVTGGLTPTYGMVAPYFWNAMSTTFLTYDSASGFRTNSWDKTNLTAAVNTDKVNLGAPEALPAAGVSVYALKSAYAISANGSAVLTNGSGGLILTGNTITHSAPMAFGAEAVVYVTQENTLSGTITGSGGLTKSGAGKLILSANNVGTLTGGIAANDGYIELGGDWTRLGGTVNTVTLNGGGLRCNNAATAITNDIVLGLRGGTLQDGKYFGNISGSGRLNVTAYGAGLRGVNNTYTGGTAIPAGGCDVGSGSSLGTGPVVVGTENSNMGADAPKLTLNGNGNLKASQSLVLRGFRGQVAFVSANPVVGSIEGDGVIQLGTASLGVTLRVGGNDRNTDFFGLIMDVANYTYGSTVSAYPSKLIKEGTGTLTLWGDLIYSGGTIVSNGTLCVNNWLNTGGTVIVRPGATLDGIGTVGIVSNQGGTVKGNLYMRSLNLNSASTYPVTLNGTNAVTDYSQLHVSEGINLNSDGGAGSTLNLTLNYAPSPGHMFTILNNTSGASVTGTFSGGARISQSFGGKTFWFKVDYNGGASGKDIVLTCIPSGTVFTIR